MPREDRYFGEGNFKSSLLERIDGESDYYKLSPAEVAAQVAEVLGHLCLRAFSRDEEIARVREESKETAKRELIAQLQRG